MMTLFQNEVNPLIGDDSEKIRVNFTNNIRWLYIDLFDSGKVRNVKDFAILCHLSQSTVESWLRRGVIPKPERRKMIERLFDMTEGCLMREIRPEIQNWSLEYYNRNGAKPTLKTYVPDDEDLTAVAEPNSECARDIRSDMEKLCKELAKYKDLLYENKIIREITSAWAILIVILFISCETLDFNDTSSYSEDNPAPMRTDTCIVWNGHIGVNCEYLDNGLTDILLLSLNEWKDLPSANNLEEPELLQSICSDYQENGLGGWHIPNVAEAELLRDNYTNGSELFISLNLLMTNMGAMEMRAMNGKENVRYLCDEGLKSFSLTRDTKISNAGAKSRKYTLRLVRHIVAHLSSPQEDNKYQEQLDDYLIDY